MKSFSSTNRLSATLFSSLLASFAIGNAVMAQGQLVEPATQRVPAAATSQPAPSAEKPYFTQQELDQLLAPLALYPDALLSQVLIASTYPIEIVQADRWIKEHANLAGDQLTSELEKQPWDPSVKSLVNFPTVLSMLSEKLDWTVSLGDAFIGQEKQVMETVQSLRTKAQVAGNLAPSKELNVQSQPDGNGNDISIEPVQQDAYYIPMYDPNYVYGTWWYPDYPPHYYYYSGFVMGGRNIVFGDPCRLGPSWGYAWGTPNWRDRTIYIDTNRGVDWNPRIDRDRYRNIIARDNSAFRDGRGPWVHDPVHRRGVWYRDADAANRFGRLSPEDAARQRDAYRGRNSNDARRDNQVLRPAAPDPNAPGQGNPRPTQPPPQPRSQNRDGAISGTDRGSDARRDSDRGAASRGQPRPTPTPAPAPAVKPPPSTPARPVTPGSPPPARPARSPGAPSAPPPSPAPPPRVAPSPAPPPRPASPARPGTPR